MTKSLGPLLSVIIPTRERCETLAYALETVLDQTTESLEIIVSDNFSQDDTKAVVRRFEDPRVRYLNTGQRLSMCDNYEFAVTQARGEYVIIIGDDDAVVPGALDRLDAVIKKRPSLVYFWQKGIYAWPIEDQPARVISAPPPGRFREINLTEWARFSIEWGGLRWARMPSPYHSAVARSALDELRRRTGRVFHSTQPDTFTYFAVPVVCPKFLEVDFYVTWCGVSAKANGGSLVSKKCLQNIQTFFAEYGDYKIHPTLFPGAPPIPNLIIDAILVAMDKYPEFYGTMKFNYSAMWAVIRRLSKEYYSPFGLWDVVKMRRDIRRYHPLSVPMYLLASAIAWGSAWRQRLAKMKQQGPREEPPSNIADYVRELAARPGGGAQPRARAQAKLA